MLLYPSDKQTILFHSKQPYFYAKFSTSAEGYQEVGSTFLGSFLEQFKYKALTLHLPSKFSSNVQAHLASP
jgi:hypothetical protein